MKPTCNLAIYLQCSAVNSITCTHIIWRQNKEPDVPKKTNDESGVSQQQVLPVVLLSTQDHKSTEEWMCGRRF